MIYASLLLAVVLFAGSVSLTVVRYQFLNAIKGNAQCQN